MQMWVGSFARILPARPFPSVQSSALRLRTASTAAVTNTTTATTIPFVKPSTLRFPVITSHIYARSANRASYFHTESRNPFANALPSQLRILRSAEATKQNAKEVKEKEEKETTASRAV